MVPPRRLNGWFRHPVLIAMIAKSYPCQRHVPDTFNIRKCAPPPPPGRCLDFLLPILEFLRLIIQHHGVWNHGRISSLILTTSVRIIAHDSRRKSCHNFVYHRKSSLTNIRRRNTRRLLGVLPFWKWRILPRIRTACFARISRGVPRVAFSFTITLYLVRMKKK